MIACTCAAPDGERGPISGHFDGLQRVEANRLLDLCDLRHPILSGLPD